MKFDRTTIAAVVFCLALLFIWPHIVQKIWPYTPKPKTEVTAPATERPNQVQPTSNTKATSPSQPAETVQSPKTNTANNLKNEVKAVAPKTAPVLTSVKEQPPVTLKNENITVKISPNSGEIFKIILSKYKKSDKKTIIELLKGVQGGALGVYPINETWTLTGVDIKLEEKDTPKEIVTLKREFTTTQGGHFAISQKWSIEKDYTINNVVKVTNLGNTPLTLKNIALSAGGLEKITDLAGDQVFREDHEINYYSITEDKLKSETAETGAGFMAMVTGAAKGKPKTGFNKTVNEKAKWIGVTNKYFTALLVPDKPFDDGIILKSVVMKNSKGKEYIMAETAGIINFESIEPNESQIRKFTYFVGPKKIALLKEVDPDASKIMKLYMLGMRFLEPISRLMLDVLIWLKNWCGSYGLSIILLTLIVKTIFWPITHRANVSMRKMQKIQPLIKELRKKYKDKPQQVNAEMMKLYKEHKVNPLGGCLPILLQMPIFFALYATLSGSIEPRHTAFLWMHDLSMPDTVAHIFGLPINPLMLMMTITMILQQKLTPSAADPAQQKMMMFMPLIMLVMLYSLPSGLTLYWTVSQFISVAQLIVNKQIEKRAELKEASA